MKKLMVVLLTIIAFASCSKKTDCKCGIITDDDIKISSTFDVSYILTIKNDCSGNNKDFYVNESSWMNNVVGDHTCMNETW